MDLRLLLTPLMLLVLAAAAPSAHGQGRTPGDLGVGGQVGNPSGITLKAYARHDHGYAVLAAWDLNDFFFLNGSTFYERPLRDSPLHYFLGPGIVLGLEQGRGGTGYLVGASALAGLNFFTGRFEVFLQLSPRLMLLPATKGHFDGGVGLRYYL